MPISCPSVFFTLWTIRRVTHQIGQIRIIRNPPQIIDQGRRSMNEAFLSYIAMHKIGGDMRVIKHNRLATRHFYIPETLIIKFWHKLILLLPAENEYIRLEWILFLVTKVIHIYI